jgi:hypothetical protein
MTHADALQLHGELTKLASRPPGADEEGKKKMNQILFRFSCDTDCGGYLREKASEVGSFSRSVAERAEVAEMGR